MSQHEIALKMVKHGMNIGLIISRTQTTLYIISSENHICNLRPWRRLGYYFKHHDGVEAGKAAISKVFAYFSFYSRRRTPIYLLGRQWLCYEKKSNPNEKHSNGPYIFI